MDKFARLEAARKARAGVEPKRHKARKRRRKGHWTVVKVHDDGRALMYQAGLTEDDAHALAGYARDHMTDWDVGAGWNYLARPRRPLPRAVTPDRGFRNESSPRYPDIEPKVRPKPVRAM